MGFLNTPLSEEQIFERMAEFRKQDVDWRSGKAFGYVYDAGAEVQAVAKKAFSMFLTENGLDPTSFGSLLRFENEIIGIAREHLNGDEKVVGNFTSGGTESILLAVKTARDYGRAKKNISTPEMILPVTAHAAFHKAAHYFGIKPIILEVDENFRADPAAIEQAITDNTVLIVASAPSYAHGVVDPIPEIGAIAQERDLLFHVDACIGGWLLPFFKRLGDDITDFDFKVPGVTSISMDLHKYAYAPKGASVVLYRDAELRRHQIYGCASWSGYCVVNPTVQSSKSGGPLAAAWAVLHFIGDEGYMDIARRLRTAALSILDGLGEIEGIKLLTRPDMPSLIAFHSDSVNVFHLCDEMNSRGWYVQAQFENGHSPANIHLTVAPSNIPHIPALLSDLKDSVAAAKELGESAIPDMLKGMLAGMDWSQFTPEALPQMLGALGMSGTDLPSRRATINELLNMLPIAAKELVLKEFMNQLFTAPQAASASA